MNHGGGSRHILWQALVSTCESNGQLLLLQVCAPGTGDTMVCFKHATFT